MRVEVSPPARSSVSSDDRGDHDNSLFAARAIIMAALSTCRCANSASPSSMASLIAGKYDGWYLFVLEGPKMTCLY